MNLPRLDLHPLQRRALINAGIAAFVTLVLGLSLQAALGGDGEDAVAGATTSPSPSPEPAACVPTWEVVQAADPGTLPNALRGITALAAGEAWAVGASGDPVSPDEVLIERWDGSAWTAEVVEAPGSETNELLAVDASEPNDVWAVGRTASGFGDRPLVLHHDGSVWTIVAMPPDVTGVLTGVDAVAPNDVWAVGFTGDPAASLNRALILHWDGEVWALVDAGRAVGGGASLLNDVTSLADRPDVVGELHNRPLMIRFDGERWEQMPSDVRGVVNAVEPVDPEEAWAVGSPIQRFSEGTWTPAANVRAGGQLFAVAAVSPDDVWAVGVRPGGEATKALVVRYDGRRWKPVDGPPVPGSDTLTGIDALPDGTVLAVGYKDVESGRKTLAIRGSTCLPTT